MTGNWTVVKVTIAIEEWSCTLPRPSRRQEILQAAQDAFADRGYHGTSVGQLAQELGLSKAAISYHFPTKVDLLRAAVEPLLSDLEQHVLSASRLDDPGECRDFLEAYADVVLRHRSIARWVDTDPGVLTVADVRCPLDRIHQRTRWLLAGSEDPARLVAAVSALGALWRPVRRLDPALPLERDELVDAALAILAN